MSSAMRPRRKLSQEEERTLLTRGGALAAIAQHPSWSDLLDEIALKEQRLRAMAMAKVLASKPVDQREIDFLRGFIAGMRWLTMLPTGAEARLENYLKKHGVSSEGEQE